MPRFYEPDLGADPNSPFARAASNKLVRRSYWLDMNDRSIVMVMTQGIGAHLTNDEKRAHLIDLKRKHLIDHECIQEIFRPKKGKQCCRNAVAFLHLHLKCHRRRAKKSEFPTRIKLSCTWSGTLPRHSVFARCAASIWWGNPMKNVIAAHLPDEHFFLECTERRLAASGSISAARRKS